MNVDEFRTTLSDAEPPGGSSRALGALWWDAKGDWGKAHECAQAEAGADGAWVHAYLHRKEGDVGNAGYWYRRAGRGPSPDPLDAEWEKIAAALLRQG